MQERYAVVRGTNKEFTRPVYTSQNTFSLYGDSDEESDRTPPTPENTKATEKKIDISLRNFIEALPHLETLHYGFKVPKHQEEMHIVFALLQNAFLLGGKNITLIMIIQFVHQDSLMVNIYSNIVVIKAMIITQQLPIILQICSIIE
jgi:hypothetical protein